MCLETLELQVDSTETRAESVSQHNVLKASNSPRLMDFISLMKKLRGNFFLWQVTHGNHTNIHSFGMYGLSSKTCSLYTILQATAMPIPHFPHQTVTSLS